MKTAMSLNAHFFITFTKHLHFNMYFFAILPVFHIICFTKPNGCKWQVTRRKDICLPCPPCAVFVKKKGPCFAVFALHMSNHLSAFRKTWNHLPGKRDKKTGADDHGGPNRGSMAMWDSERLEGEKGVTWELVIYELFLVSLLKVS